MQKPRVQEMIGAHTLVCLFTDVLYPWHGAILNTEKYSTEAALREFSMILMIYFILISYRISETGESKGKFRIVDLGHNYLGKFCYLQ